MVTTLYIVREIEETYPLVLRAVVTAEQAMSVGHASIGSFIVAASSATVHLLVPVSSVTVVASITARQIGADAELLMTFALPVSITDTAQARSYRVVFEPGSPTSERVICQGTITINARPTQA